MSDETGPSVLVLGLDGVCQHILDPLVEAGVVPNLAALLDDGVSGPLTSQIPPWTPSAWPSLFTGVNPGKHGVYGFLSFDGYDWRVVDYTDVRAHALWELLDYHDRTSVVVNVPVTHPPQPIDGAVIPGYIAPEDPTCHPTGLLESVRDQIGEYQVYAPDVEDRSAQIDAYQSLVRMRGEAFRYLCDRFEPEFGFVQFQQTDTVFHERPDDDEAIEAVYRAVDQEIGEILAASDPELVAVVSDHGMGPMGGYEFRVNDFLHDNGYLDTKRGGEMPSWSTVATTQLRDGKEGESPSPSLSERLFAQLARVGLTSQRIERILTTLGLRDVALRFAPTEIVQAAAEQPDFRTSRAYMRDRVECGIRLNLAGREPDGTVSSEEYEAVRDELIELLRSVETPAGRPVFEHVVRRETVYHGPHVEKAADIITVPTAFDEFLSSSVRGETFGPVPESYNHKFEGLVAMAGPAADTDADIDRARLLDIAPTLLSALDVPLSERFDGRALPVVPESEEQSYPEYTETTTAETVAGEKVEERLTDLGYIE